MFFIFGTRSSQRAAEKVAVKCQYCQSPDSVWMYIYQSYFHIFWIPFFPYSTKSVTECSHCKQVLRSKEFDEDLRRSSDELKRRTKTPIWTFSLIILFFVLVLFITISAAISRL